MACLPAGRDLVRLCGQDVGIPALHTDAPRGLVLGVRPEHVRLAAHAGVVGEVFGVEYMGARQVVTVDTEAGRLRVRTPNSQRATVGERVGLAFDPEQIILFDAATERALPSALFAEAGHG